MTSGKYPVDHSFPPHIACVETMKGSWTPTPDNATDDNGDVVGDRCPAGHYCTEGSEAPRACEAGTYSKSTGNTDSTACLPCEPGLMCPNTGTIVPTLPCPEGFYCPAGTLRTVVKKGQNTIVEPECQHCSCYIAANFQKPKRP